VIDLFGDSEQKSIGFLQCVEFPMDEFVKSLDFQCTTEGSQRAIRQKDPITRVARTIQQENSHSSKEHRLRTTLTNDQRDRHMNNRTEVMRSWVMPRSLGEKFENR
jgi:hypothetical protein